MKVRLDTDGLLRRRGLGDSHAARRALADAAARMAEPYIPRDTGALIGSAEVSTDGRQLRYTAPYAAAQYYGRFRNYTGNAGGLRGGRWMERMLADKREALLQAVARETGGKPK